MRITFTILLNLALLTQQVGGQKLSGKITDNSGRPVPYATVYLQELRQGTTSNTSGEYEIRLPEGKYTVTYQSLGYEPITENLAIADSVTIKNIVLTEQIYDIPEVSISHSGEDPSLYIMRKAIGLAPYYLNYINYFKAEVYLKGNLFLKNIPKLLEKSMRMSSDENSMTISAGAGKKEKPGTIKEGDTYLMESYNEIEFTAPDKYKQTVKSFNSSFPLQGNEVSPMGFIQASFYQPVLAEMAISPLSPQAFSHYNFKYEGASLQGDFTINKIAVIPKRKSQQLFEGTIFIVEDLWCIHSLDLTNENFASVIRVRELYAPVHNDIWMPVSHQIDIEVKVFGFKADAGYTSSVRYLEVTQNDKLQKPHDLITGYAGTYIPGDSVKSKNKKEIERLMQKEELSNRDMMKLARLMDKEATDSRPDSVKTLEIKDNTTRIIDEDASGKDSTYWASVRPIPLSAIEIRSIQRSDSIKTILAETSGQETDSLKNSVNQKSKFGRSVMYIISGHTWSDTSGFRFTHGGLIDPSNLSFNTVDGFKYGIDFRINKNFGNKKSIAFYPDFSYAFSRERLLWRLNSTYSASGKHPNLFYIRTGVTSKDINSNGGINPLINSITSLFFRLNYLKVYESRYVTAGYETSFSNGMGLKFSAGYDNRKVLDNNTSFSIFRADREYKDNIPVNEYLITGAPEVSKLYDQKHFEIVTNVTFTPYQRYRMNDGTRIPMGSDWPTFSILWKHGINQTPSPALDYKHFDMFRFEVSQRRETGVFSELRWNIRAGGFADNRNVSFFDFFHFNSQPLYVTINDYDDAFMLSEFYSLSTPELFGEAHFRYTTPYLILKLLPGLSKTLIRENLHFGYLGSRFRSHYFEIGYSLSEILLLGEAGVYAGFNDFKYNSIGLRFSLKLQ